MHKKTVYMYVYIVILENHLDVNLFMQVSLQKHFSPTMLFSEVVAVITSYEIKIFSHPLPGILHCTPLHLSEKISTVYEHRSQTSSSTHSHKMSKPVFIVSTK